MHGSSPSLEKDPAEQGAKGKRYVKCVLNPDNVSHYLMHLTCYENIIYIPLQLAIFLAPTSGRVLVNCGHGIHVV